MSSLTPQVDVVNTRKRSSFAKWTVLKRFGQFFELDASLRAEFASDARVLALFPASPTRQSKLLHDHSDAHFVAHRATLLEHYLHTLLDIKELRHNPTFLTFLGVQI